MTNKNNNVVQTGVTNDLKRRVYEHKNKMIDGFTKRYNTKILVYYEHINDPTVAIQREKQLKKWKRKWKINLIEKANPDWNDLYEEILDNKNNSQIN